MTGNMSEMRSQIKNVDHCAYRKHFLKNLHNIIQYKFLLKAESLVPGLSLIISSCRKNVTNQKKNTLPVLKLSVPMYIFT